MKYHFTPIYGDALVCMYIHVAEDGAHGIYEVGLQECQDGDYSIVELTNSGLLDVEHYGPLQTAIKALLALR